MHLSAYLLFNQFDKYANDVLKYCCFFVSRFFAKHISSRINQTRQIPREGSEYDQKKIFNVEVTAS